MGVGNGERKEKKVVIQSLKPSLRSERKGRRWALDGRRTSQRQRGVKIRSAVVNRTEFRIGQRFWLCLFPRLIKHRLVQLSNTLFPSLHLLPNASLDRQVQNQEIRQRNKRCKTQGTGEEKTCQRTVPSETSSSGGSVRAAGSQGRCL